MATFREHVEQDFQDIFLDQDEFGETCRWNDVVLEYLPVAAAGDLRIEANGINEEVRRIRCAKSALTPSPVPNEMVLIDGEEWRVANVRPAYDNLLIDLVRDVS